MLPAPRRYAQSENYNDIGRPWLEAQGVDFVGVVDIDEMLWSARPGLSLRDLVVGAFADPGAAQFSCPFHHFGSSGFDRQPPSVRECFTRRSAVTSEVVHGKSFVRLRDLNRFVIHIHDVRGATIPCPYALLNFHFKAQSREYWERVKLHRGDANAEHDNAARSWEQFGRDDRTGNATEDTRLRDALRRAGARAAC